MNWGMQASENLIGADSSQSKEITVLWFTVCM